ncbi:MAG TPA: hypothetical protein K8V32_10040 [Enteractinococcus helveticum]|uniref:Uncharacterized protein n=1 Tax=Enteractinococcus helveticum TaxID=1837282 RepID=A0A921K7T2_9MICC|nr:hypothetical protein [Enteractinococcus helveticum]HJF15125.1 hypothetical protein [Enteractinococcus helveticum]
MNTTLTPIFGRELTDDELATFHGGYCDITISRDNNGRVTGVSHKGTSCGAVTVIVNA